MDHVGVRWVMQGKSGSYRGVVGHEGVGWFKQRWVGLCRGGWVMLGWGGVGMGWVCRCGVGWVMQGGVRWVIQGWDQVGHTEVGWGGS